MTHETAAPGDTSLRLRTAPLISMATWFATFNAHCSRILAVNGTHTPGRENYSRLGAAPTEGTHGVYPSCKVLLDS